MTFEHNRNSAHFDNRGNSVLSQVGRDLNVKGNFNVHKKSQEPFHKLPWVEDAAFNSYSLQHDSLCMEDTRVDLLGHIIEWSKNPHERCIFWLNGLAGTGKSTVARTIAHKLDKQGRLGATFFFSRGRGDRGHAARFFTSIARCLADSIPALRNNINEAIAERSGIARQALRDQWKYLIYQPLTRLGNDQDQAQAFTIIIDALDECEGDDDVRTILQIITEAKNLNTIRLSIFITCRPETPIRLGFKKMDGIIYRDLVLHNIPKHTIEHDILIFLTREMNQIQQDHEVSEDWPGQHNIEIIARRAAGLFIYAATVCRFIGDLDDPEGPEERLNLVLHGNSNCQSSTKTLDEIYTQVLERSIKKNDEDSKKKLRENFRYVVGSIIVLSDALSIPALAKLLFISEGKVIASLRFLHSLLDIPHDFNSPIRLLHPSFRDFLLDDQRCSSKFFWIDKEKAHSDLAKKCLELMTKTLKRNICNLGTPGAAPNEAESDDDHNGLPANVQYACLYWFEHFCQARHVQRDLCDDDQIYQFFQEHFLHWLEALSLMAKIPEGVFIITRFESMLEPGKNHALYGIVHDAKRFILNNRRIIEEAPLQVYVSALVFSPKRSIIKNCYMNQLPTWIRRHPVTENDWSSSLQTLEGHSRSVNAVSFSPDGKQLASASYDHTVRLWDAASGAPKGTLEGHSDWVNAVAFSPDGKQLASASNDRTVRLWDAASGASQGTLEGHSDSVGAVVFSPDGKQLASASHDRTLRLWDVASGVPRGTLGGHSGVVNAVAFSPDGKQLALASSYDTVLLWDVASRESRGTLAGHSGLVNAVVFSPDGKQLASASNDNTVRLWDAASGASQVTLEGHSDWVKAVAFSPDGKRLASASHDCTLRLWDVASGESQGELTGHLNWVGAVVFSPDGRQLASASYDRTVRLWDPATRVLRGIFERNSSSVIAVAFSPDGKQLASASDNCTVRLWDVASGGSRGTLEGHSGSVYSVVFSPDGKQLASVSNNMVRLWDAASGASQGKLKGDSDWVRTVAFSRDSKQLASASDDYTIRLWDAASRASRGTLAGHSGPVNALAFSSDGTQLASASNDHTIRLWDADSGSPIKTFNIKGVSAVSFSADGSYLDTNCGPLQLKSTLNYTQSQASPVSPWMINGNWLTWNNQKALWLPVDFRPCSFITHGNLFAIGHSCSDQITFLELAGAVDLNFHKK